MPHLAAAITGTAAVLRASGVAFEVIKFAGVAYLLGMAWQTWRDHSLLAITAKTTPRSSWRVICSAVLANLLNPKLTLSFFAFLPQFVPIHGGDQLPRMLALSLVFMAMTFVVFAFYGLFAAAARRHLIEPPGVVARLRKLFAVSFVALGAKLATTARA